MKKARALNTFLANKKDKYYVKDIKEKRSNGRSFLQRKDLNTNTLYLQLIKTLPYVLKNVEYSSELLNDTSRMISLSDYQIEEWLWKKQRSKFFEFQQKVSKNMSTPTGSKKKNNLIVNLKAQRFVFKSQSFQEDLAQMVEDLANEDQGDAE